MPINIDDSFNPIADGTPRGLRNTLNGFAHAIKLINGKNSWREPPDISLQEILINGNSDWITITSDTSLSPNNKYLVNSFEEITVFLPESGEIEICNPYNTVILCLNAKFNGVTLTNARIVFNGSITARFLYINSSVGWISLNGRSAIVKRGYGSPLLWLQGSLEDISGNSRNAVPIPGATAPEIITGLNNKSALRFDASNQELQITPFLSSYTGATLYIVFSPDNETNYNLIKTADIDDYWRFQAQGEGYLGTFRSQRFESYPPDMPSFGNHLISIHAGNDSYEVIQNNVSKGVRFSIFHPGDRFRIAANDKPFTGDISLVLVYPYHPANSAEYSEITNSIRQEYPSILFVD